MDTTTNNNNNKNNNNERPNKKGKFYKQFYFKVNTLVFESLDDISKLNKQDDNEIIDLEKLPINNNIQKKENSKNSNNNNKTKDIENNVFVNQNFIPTFPSPFVNSESNNNSSIDRYNLKRKSIENQDDNNNNNNSVTNSNSTFVIDNTPKVLKLERGELLNLYNIIVENKYTPKNKNQIGCENTSTGNGISVYKFGYIHYIDSSLGDIKIQEIIWLVLNSQDSNLLMEGFIRNLCNNKSCQNINHIKLEISRYNCSKSSVSCTHSPKCYKK